MKLWKCVSIILMLCGAALSVFLSRVLLSSKAHALPHLEHSSSLLSASASPMSSKSSSSGTRRMIRRVRSADGDNSVVSDLMHMFQTFTEGELKQVIDTLVQREARRVGKRTKRAKKGAKRCSLTDKVMTVSQLGLGYISDEEIRFRYCSGKCGASRKNYDLVLAKLKKQHLFTQEPIKRAPHSPCCRPTEYDNITFLDNNHKYHTIVNFSALNCVCV